MTHTSRTIEKLEVVGGSLCLDFTNTVNSRHETEHDYLRKYSDLVDWAVKVDILSARRSTLLRKLAEQDVIQAEAALLKARELRELLYRIFSKVTREAEPDGEDLEAFVKLYAEAIAHGEFERKDEYFTVQWTRDGHLDAVLWPVLYSAGQLLLSEDLSRVKECPSCGWLFVDTSKNRSRRWCSMNTCGVRDKMRRYHRKLQEKNA